MLKMESPTDAHQASSGPAKMRIDSIVSTQSISPSTPKASTRVAGGQTARAAEVRRTTLQVLLMEATRAALEDEVVSERRQPPTNKPTVTASQPRPPLIPISALVRPSVSSTCSSSSTLSPSSTSSSPSRLAPSTTTAVRSGGGFHRLHHPSSTSLSNLSFNVVGRSKVALPSTTSTTTSSPPVGSPSCTTLPKPTEPSSSATKENEVRQTPAASSSSPTAPRRQVQVFRLSGERRPLATVNTSVSVTSAPSEAACPSPLKRTQSFPPPTPSTPTGTLNVRKRSLEEVTVSPSTANGARILAQSLPNVKIHVQKKIKLMPKPAGQVQPRPEGVRNVLVYHF